VLGGRRRVRPYRSRAVAYDLLTLVAGSVRVGVNAPRPLTVKEVVATLTINPNTVLHAYRQLDLEGLTEGRRGVGTFVAESRPAIPASDLRSLRTTLDRWVARAREAGVDEDTIAALFAEAIRPDSVSRVA